MSRRVCFLSLLLLGACGGGGAATSNPGGGGGRAGHAGTAGTTGGAGTTGAAGTTASGGTTGTGGIGAAGTPGSAGTTGAAGMTGAAGAMGAAGTTGAAGAGAAGRGGSGGAAGRGGAGATGGGASGGSGGGTACTRELLRNTIAAYFTALAAHSSSTLPVAASVKFTENGRTMTLGSTPLWMNAGMVKHTQSALDTEQCMSATHAVVPEGNMDIPFALRVRLQNQQITEIETIAVRPGDYSLASSNPAAIISMASNIRWEDSVPTAMRATRAELIAWMDKYFRMFPRGVCNTTSACRRLENGGGNFVCSNGGSCAAGQPGPNDNAMMSRLILADAEAGIGVGHTMFMGNTDMHMFKMSGGQVHAVHAILGMASSSGW